ncbi:MAG: DUF429 domain-containing protein [Proteobacteria bacterium]|nr:DUF429 domain-containing protein [Pseudomonadota bacterium]
MNTKVSFGLDPAGYSTGKSAFAMAKRIENGSIEVTVLSGTPFSRKKARKDVLQDIVEAERAFVKTAIDHGPLYLDVPLDLQKLSSPTEPKYLWELTMRPVDFAFNAMPPLADRLGAVVARMKHILEPFEKFIGKKIFETYPKLSLKRITASDISYKGQSAEIECNDEDWSGGEGLKSALKAANFKTTDRLRINDDEFDAALCALCGVSSKTGLLKKKELTAIIKETMYLKLGENYKGQSPGPPKGFVVLKEPSTDKINVHKTACRNAHELRALISQKTKEVMG